jgi:hypothetical protein
MGDAMKNVDDRLAGDPVWELFLQPTAGSGPRTLAARRYTRWLVAGVLVALSILVYPPLAGAIVCLSFAAPDFHAGRQLVRSILSKAGGRICARFRYAWGAWKLGASAFILLLVSAAIFPLTGETRSMVATLMTLVLLWIGGFTVSSVFTALGLLEAYRSGMRVWIGEGVNQARTLLLGMLIVAFTFVVLGPVSIWVAGLSPRAPASRAAEISLFLACLVCQFAGPVGILIVLDRISRRIIADRPGKFGSKVPTVGKWN